MIDSDKNRFAELMSLIAENYSRPISKNVITLYWEGLKQFDYETVARAMWMHLKNPDSGQYMPKIADIVRLTEGGTADQAQQAWIKVESAVKRVGTWADVVFDDPLTHRIIADLGGWIWLGQQTEKEWPFVAKRFEAAYRGYRARGEVPDYPPKLTGIANLENSKEGMPMEPPVLIGDRQRAEAVMLGGKNQNSGFVRIGNFSEQKSKKALEAIQGDEKH